MAASLRALRAPGCLRRRVGSPSPISAPR